ncbi:MAG: 2-keto-3-deoxygluconate permease [Clostridiaceae bacterium]|nr:2-keto-3-deoxygluconate permease [Clostridiaceae bacterium]
MKIARFIRKIPAGTLLIPMFISSLFYTFAPTLFNIGGTTQAIFTGESLNFIIGVACFCSGLLLDFKTLLQVLKKQGSLILLKLTIASLVGHLYINFIGLNGVFGISALALVITLFACNPAIYLSLAETYGNKQDVAAYGLTGLLSLPVFPMIFLGLQSNQTTFNYMPLISTLIPILVGMVLGNLDQEIRNFFSPLLGRILPFMGWALGASINLIDAFKSGLSGIILVLLFYGLLIPPLYLFERKVLKTDGVSTIALSAMPGLAIGFPRMLADVFPGLEPFAASAAANIAFAVVITSILTPILAKIVYQRNQTKM